MCELIGSDYLEEDRKNKDIITVFPASIRLTLGWFFPENSDGENAIYWDYYFAKDGRVTLVLDEGNHMLDIPICDIEVV